MLGERGEPLGNDTMAARSRSVNASATCRWPRTGARGHSAGSGWTSIMPFALQYGNDPSGVLVRGAKRRRLAQGGRLLAPADECEDAGLLGGHVALGQPLDHPGSARPHDLPSRERSGGVASIDNPLPTGVLAADKGSEKWQKHVFAWKVTPPKTCPMDDMSWRKVLKELESSPISKTGRSLAMKPRTMQGIHGQSS